MIWVTSKNKLNWNQLKQQKEVEDFWKFDVEVPNLTVPSGFQLRLYVTFLPCHLLGHLHAETTFRFVHRMTVGVTGLTTTNHKIQHKRKYSMIYDTVLDIFLIVWKTT